MRKRASALVDEESELVAVQEVEAEIEQATDETVASQEIALVTAGKKLAEDLNAAASAQEAQAVFDQWKLQQDQLRSSLSVHDFLIRGVFVVIAL